MDDLAQLVGERIRAAGYEREVSLSALAEAAGIGKGSLSEIENGVRNPTLRTLSALADALDTPLAALVASQPVTPVGTAGIETQQLAVTNDAGATVEVCRLHLDAGTRHRSAGHGRGVIEHLLVVSGRARVGRLRHQVELAEGESSSWRADVAHSYLALDGMPVEAVLVVRTPPD